MSSSVDDLLDTGVSHQDRQDLKGMDLSERDNPVLDERMEEALLCPRPEDSLEAVMPGDQIFTLH